ncbi:hypothetical protein ABXJ76_17130 [Methylobacter sp. G7]|uniref:hypothetical protein n=1 Tax=Methylobacter sp. G7 TaxID=3230117 RepID=UPI003D8097C7
MGYKIIFVDEQRDEQNDFKAAFAEFIRAGKVNVITLFPAEDLDEMIERIRQENPDALVSDWSLNDFKEDLPRYYDVSYYGSELVEAFLRIREGFPCFIASSFDSDASRSNSTKDVNLVYSKELDIEHHKDNQDKHLTFPQKILLQIEKYRARITEAEESLEQLHARKRQGNNLSLKEEDELIRLDSFLERALDTPSAIPEEFKKSSNSKQLNNLINSVNELLEKVKNAN